MDANGVLVVFEGIDGAGTTTQAERYASRLRERRRMVHVTREPSTGPIGSMIRLALTRRIAFPSPRQAEMMALLFAADRIDHVEAEIEPFLRDGYVVLSDRYDLSSLTYQSATSASGDESLAWIRTLNKFARRPDITVVVDVSPEVAAKRRRERGGVLELFDDAELQTRLADAYRRADQLVPGDRVVHVDGDGTQEEVARAIAAALDPLCGPFTR